MGESPDIPSVLSEEGVEFVECCLVHDPKERWTATELLEHTNFCKVIIFLLFKIIYCKII
jgi:serine/threonine protein kinase